MRALLFVALVACKPIPTCSEPVNCPDAPDDEVRVCCAHLCWWEADGFTADCGGFGDCTAGVEVIADYCGLSENPSALVDVHAATAANTPRDEYPESQTGP